MASIDEQKALIAEENTPSETALPSVFSPIEAEIIPASNVVQPGDPGYGPSRQRLQDIKKEQELFRESFNVGKAALRGKTDADVLNYVLKTYPSTGGAEQNIKDYQTAKSRGLSDAQILAKLTRAQEVGPLGAIAQEAARGVVEMGPAAAGGYMGFQIGLLGGPVAWLTAPAGGAIGALAGFMAGDTASGALFSEDPYVPSVRPYGEMGYTGGASIPFVLMPGLTAGRFVPGTWSFSRNIANLNGRNQATLQNFKQTPIERMQRLSVEKPATFYRTEAAGVGGASYGAFLAEQKYPGNEMVRFAAETVGGVASPVAVADYTINTVGKGIKALGQTMSQKGRESRQGQALGKWLAENGEDPKQLLKSLENQEAVAKLAADLGVDMPSRTTAGVTGSPALYKLLSTLAKDPAYGPTIRNALARDYANLANLTDILNATGDPSLVSQAAVMRKKLMDGIIIQRLDDVNASVMRLNKKVAPDDPEASMKASANIEALTAKAIEEMRGVEKQYYDAIDGSEVVSAPNLTEAFTNIEDDLVELGINVPYVVRSIVYKTRGESVDAAEANVEKITRINSRINKADDSIAAINAANPDSVAAVNARISADAVPEQQLFEVQDAIRALEADDALTKFSIKAPERNRQLTVLRNKAQILNGRLEISDLKSQKAIPPEGFDSTITLKELMNGRSKLLGLARDATANNNFSKAHFYSDLADAIVDDFGIKVPEGAQLTENQAALQQAFDFSRSLNDVFSRAFPNVVLSRNKTGARRIMPELLSKATFSGGGDATSLKYSQLEDAMVFAANNANADMAETLTGQIGSMRAAQEDLMRVAYEKIIDATTGRVSVEKLNDFKKEYKNVLPLMPELQADLEDVRAAQNLMDERIALTGDPRSGTVKGSPLGNNIPKEGVFQERLAEEISFYNAIGSDTNPNKLIGITIGSPGDRPDNPAKGLRTLIRNVTNAESKFPGAKNGLRNMIIDRAYSFASGMNEAGKQTFDFAKFNQFLNMPLSKGQPSTIEILRQEGVVDEGFATRLNILSEEGIKTKRAQLSTRDPDAETTKLPLPLLNRGFDAFVKVTGLRIGRAATQAAPGTGQGLAEPMIIGREVMDIFVDVPASKQKDLLIEAALKPEIFKALMESYTPNTPRYLPTVDRLRSALTRAGFIGATAQERYNEQKAKRSAPPTPMMMPGLIQDGTLPVTPDISPGLIKPDQRASLSVPTPAAQPTTAMASAAPVQPQPPAPPPVASGPVDRSRYAALFPGDIASSMIRQQGIGSLMG